MPKPYLKEIVKSLNTLKQVFPSLIDYLDKEYETLKARYKDQKGYEDVF